MKKIQSEIDIEIDKLTNSIENRITNDGFQTEVLILEKADLKHISKKNGWLFDWKAEFQLPDRNVYKLTITGNPTIIQGLISISERKDHVFMHLIESASYNRGSDKIYLGVPGNLIAYACKVAFHRGFEGYVSFIAKTQLIDHYTQYLEAINIGGQLMVINTGAALKLINKYFK